MRQLDDEHLRHQRNSCRPGQAGSAAAERARLVKEMAGLLNALALTKRLLRDEDGAPAVKKAACAEAPRLWPSGLDARGHAAERGARPSAPVRVLRIPA